MGIQATLRALADPTRREILNLLKHGKKSAGEITQAFSITAAAISRHLSVLKEADLIRDHFCVRGDYDLVFGTEGRKRG